LNGCRQIDRRRFLRRLGVAGCSLAAIRAFAQPATSPGSATPKTPTGVVDANVSLSRWPYRRLPLDEPQALLAKMTECGVATAWAGSFEALLHRDIGGVNLRLAEECARSGGRLIPLGAVNLSLPDWEEDLRRCHEVHRMPGIRIFPNYHGYTLADPAVKQLLHAAARRGLVTQIAVAMEDARTQHPLGRVADVDVRPLAETMAAAGAPRVMLLNYNRGIPPATLKVLAERGVCFDTARIEGVGGIGTFLRALPTGRLLFGTHAPFLNYETGLLKVHEAGLAAEEAARVLGGNARDLLRSGSTSTI